jgi:radical SAM protein with 4Fe4S-binding SPASM domain
VAGSFHEWEQAHARIQARARVPLSAHLRLVDRCNERCRHCFQVLGATGEMSTEDVLRSIDRLAEAGVLTLTVSGGEPTLHADLLPILAHARKRHFAVTLCTNATRIDEQLAEQLAALHLLDVQVSIYSSKPDEHDAVTRLPGSWEKTTHGVRLLTERGLHCAFNWPLTTFSTCSHDDMKAMADDLRAGLKCGTAIMGQEDGNMCTTEVGCERSRLLSVIGNSPLLLSELADAPTQSQALDRHICGACRSAFGVGPDGELRCCDDPVLSLGNILSDDVEAAVASPEARFLADLRWKDLHGCRDCELISYCSRCHTEARHAAGDMMGPYRSACAQAIVRYEAVTGVRVTILGSRFEGFRDREREVGPFQLEGNELRPIPDLVTEEDTKIRRVHPWVLGRPGEPGLLAVVGLTRKPESPA